MLISFSPDGTAQFTRDPILLELIPDARKSIHRMTDIIFVPGTQSYVIKFLTGPYAGQYLAPTEAFGWDDFVQEHFSDPDTYMALMAYVTFPTYEDAVRLEVAYVEYLRTTQPETSMHL